MRTNATTAATAFVNLFTTVREQLDQFMAEDNQETLVQNLRFAENIFPQSALMLCPLSHSGFKYMSPNSSHILGHHHDMLFNMSLPDFFALVHPEDLPLVQKCFDYIQGCKPYDPETHRFTMHYRMRNSHGEYVHLRDEKLSMKTAEGRYLYMILFTNVADEKFYHVTLQIYKKQKGTYTKTYTYNPKQPDSEITPRQSDIAQLIVKGFSNQEIAEQLSVSVFTVKNHKRMLFRKVNVRNSVELASFIRKG